jgi:hypothetical protein
MALEVHVVGAATLHRVAAQMRAEGRKDLSRAMSTALSKATEPVKRSIKESAAATMPREGGYAAALDKSLRFRMQRRGSGDTAAVTLVTYADGTSERRDVVALEAGRLRHPVFGRSRPGSRKGERHANPWAVTSIRAGFHKRGTDHAADEAQRQLESVIEDYAHRLVGE